MIGLLETLFDTVASLLELSLSTTEERRPVPPEEQLADWQRFQEQYPVLYESDEFDDEDDENALCLYSIGFPTSTRQRPRPARFQQINQINQQNEYYGSLRRRANHEHQAMKKSFRRSQDAYWTNNGALAKELSNKGQRHRIEKERLNKEASEWIFAENNKRCEPGEVDLHGLHVREAIVFAERSIDEAYRRGDFEVYFIVGKGLHSRDGAKIKPAIENLMRKYRLVTEVDPANAGVLIVHLDGEVSDEEHILRSDDIVTSIESPIDDDCVIM